MFLFLNYDFKLQRVSALTQFCQFGQCNKGHKPKGFHKPQVYSVLKGLFLSAESLSFFKK